MRVDKKSWPDGPGMRVDLTRRRLGMWAGALAASPLIDICGPTRALAISDQAVRIIIPLPPGGLADIVARVMQPHLQNASGKTFLIENMPGASGIIGANAVATAPPDGRTLLFETTTYSINLALRASMKQLRGLVPVSIIAEDAMLILINPKVKATTLKEFVALAKAAPNKYYYASTGIGSEAHLLFELFCKQTGIQMKHVPYPGGPPAVMATVSGETHITLMAPAASLPQVKQGALRALATGGSIREKELPNVPTAAEAGFPNFHARQWIGLLAPHGTPKPVIKRLNREIRNVLERDDVKTVLAKQGLTATSASPEEFSRLIDGEVKLWKEIAEEAHIKLAG